jgi:hypothetical protein
VHAGGPGGRAEALGHRAGHDHRLLQQPQVERLVLARQDLVDPGRPGGQDASGKTTSLAPSAAAFSIRVRAFWRLASRSRNTGAAWTAATFTLGCDMASSLR